MEFVQWFLADWANEMGKTRRLLAAVPDDNPDWRPHPKSFSIGALASHVADITGWPPFVMDRDELALPSADYTPLKAVQGGRDALLAAFEQRAEAARLAVESASEELLNRHWRLSFHGHVVLNLPRTTVLRDVVLHHLIHHRGQLSVYLRLLDKPVPGLYGASADEK